MITFIIIWIAGIFISYFFFASIIFRQDKLTSLFVAVLWPIALLDAVIEFVIRFCKHIYKKVILEQ
jgi:hypothetical protein